MIYWIKIKHIFLPPSLYFYMIMDLFRRGWGSVMKMHGFYKGNLNPSPFIIKKYVSKVINKKLEYKNYTFLKTI